MDDVRQVLLAEDDDNDVFFVTKAFRAAGLTHPLQVARDGQEAIEYLAGTGIYEDRQRHPFPCLLILDLKMPRKTGIDVLAWLRHQPYIKTLPVIVLSSSSNKYDIERAYDLCVNAFLTKPISNEERLELAKLIRGFWLRLNQLPTVCAEGLEAAKRMSEDPNFPRSLM